MPAYARVSVLIAVALPTLFACESVQDRERALTIECKKDTPCTRQGLCTGRCTPEPCVCVVGSAADCEQSSLCSSAGACAAQNGKCVIATSADCARTAACKASGFCTAKDGTCVVGTDADCAQSSLCKETQKCNAKDGACFDATFNPALLNPALLGDQPVPDKFKVKFTTSKGDFVVEVTRAWAPLGAERLFGLARIGYYANSAVFKADGSGIQFGIHAKPDVTTVWREAMIRDDASKQPNERGVVAFTKTGPNMRWAPLIVHTTTNRQLDQVGYAPVGRVVTGMEVVDALAKERTEEGPDAVKLQQVGDAYLKASFPKIQYVKGAALL